MHLANTETIASRIQALAVLPGSLLLPPVLRVGVLVPWVSRSLSSPVEQLLFNPQSVTTTRVELYICAQPVLAAGSGVVYVSSY